VHNNRNAFLALTALGGIFAWRNRFSIQRRLEAFGIRTPLLSGSIGESARSIASKAKEQMDRQATIAEDIVTKKTG
jgi:hypothetical protein